MAPQTLANGMVIPHGLGLIRERYRGVETIHHPGGVPGGSAHIVKIPAVGLDMVVMLNRGDLFAIHLADQLLDACLIGLAEEPPSARCPDVDAVFHAGPGSRIIRMRAQDGRCAIAVDGVEMPAWIDAAGCWWPEGRWYGYPRGVTHARLLGDPAAPDAVRLDEFGTVMTLPRLSAGNGERSVAGRYRWAAGSVEIDIVEMASGLQMRSRGAFGSATYRLECLGGSVWQATQDSLMLWGGILSFTADGQGFCFSGYTNRALPFTRIS